MPPPVRIAIVGNGFASRAQLPALRWVAASGVPCEVIGLAGARADKAERTRAEWKLPFATDEWRALIPLEPDLVLITTPVFLHAEMTLAFLAETEAAILCEKPFALNVSEARTMVDAAAGRAAWIDHELRWSPCRRRLRELLREGAIGPLVSWTETLHLRSPRFAERPFGWWFERRSGGGVLGALGSHLVDHARWQLGEASAVACRLQTFVRERPDREGVLRECDADEHAELELRLRSGVTARLSTSVAGPGPAEQALVAVGERGTLRMEADDRLLLEIEGRPAADVTPDPGLPSGASLGMAGEDSFARCLPAFLRDVVAAVGAGGAHLAGAARFEDGLRTQRVLDAALESASSGGGSVPC